VLIYLEIEQPGFCEREKDRKRKGVGESVRLTALSRRTVLCLCVIVLDPLQCWARYATSSSNSAIKLQQIPMFCKQQCVVCMCMSADMRNVQT